MDTFTGTTKDDLFIAENTATKTNVTAADTLDGGKGTEDTFKLYDDATTPATTTIIIIINTTTTTTATRSLHSAYIHGVTTACTGLRQLRYIINLLNNMSS